MARTLEQIRLQGLKALRKELGQAGMIRFLQQFETGNDNYAKDRHAWVDQTALDQLRAAAQAKATTKKRNSR